MRKPKCRYGAFLEDPCLTKEESDTMPFRSREGNGKIV